MERAGHHRGRGGARWISNADASASLHAPPPTPGLHQGDGHSAAARPRVHRAGSADASLQVAIVGEDMARRFWPGGDVLGKRIRIARPGTSWLTVVGIAGRVSDAHDPGVPLETWYLPFAQQAGSAAAEHVYLMVRSGGDLAATVPSVERAIWRVDKTLAPYHVSAMDAYLRRVDQPRAAGRRFMLGFAAFGLSRSHAYRVYGVMAFSVAQRGEAGDRHPDGARRPSARHSAAHSAPRHDRSSLAAWGSASRVAPPSC